jgi:hypothetical protein
MRCFSDFSSFSNEGKAYVSEDLELKSLRKELFGVCWSWDRV